MNDNKAFSVEKNNRELEAWNQWKEICSIEGCSEENTSVLAMAVSRKFLMKLRAVVPNQRYNLFVTKMDQDDEPVSEDGKHKKGTGRKDDEKPPRIKITDIMRLCCEEFDMGIIEKADFPGLNRNTGKERKKKNYKDCVWQIIEESNDEPLKVIRGLLIGPKGIINDIVENFLYKDRGFSWTNDDSGNRVLTSTPSLQDEIGGKDGTFTQLGDTIPDNASPEVIASDIDFIENEIPKLFSAKEAAAMLAYSAGIALTNSTLLDFLEVEKTQAYDVLKKTLPRLEACLKDNYEPELFPQIMQEIIKTLFSMLKTEKSASAFLSLLETKTNC